MSKDIYSVITGTGSYIPKKRVKNEDFLNNTFYEANGERIPKSNEEIIQKFAEITTIKERLNVSDDLLTSDIGYFAALEAIKDANIDKEELDYIILAQNFGDINPGTNRTDIVPSLAARVKQKLEIENPFCVAYDLPFGCPGWLQGIIQADYYIKSGDSKKILVIGADILSRVSDPHDRDSMIYADGAGATILEAKESEQPIGILAHKTRSDTLHYSQMLYMGPSNNPDYENPEDLFLKMNGRKLYQYALENVPDAIQACLQKSNTELRDVKKVLIHQANGKMDEAILKRLYRLYNIKSDPEKNMPMNISWMGNSSVATIPTLLDMILKGQMETHEINPGDIIVFASVGAGMNINALSYKM
ncbi:MAG: ketoacyl-ACP synthase III [Bacteroidales bacterium]|nr:ketoacyl-ACP synthase III [Bacteroidales bacterium]MCF8327244.1 ketoacyl-ACP synthase III [Bacteroidales bacterium]